MALIYSVNKDGTYDVKYVLGGSEKHVPAEFLRHGHHADDDSVCGRVASKRKRGHTSSTHTTEARLPKAKIAKRNPGRSTTNAKGKQKARSKKENVERNSDQVAQTRTEAPIIVFTGVKDAKNKFQAAIKRMKGQVSK